MTKETPPTDNDDEPRYRAVPPEFPYPEEEIVYSEFPDDFVPGGDSWICVSRLDEETETEANGVVHVNDYRLSIHSPVQGTESYQTNATDARYIIAAMMALIADSNNPGEDGGSFTFHPETFDFRLPDRYELLTSEDRCE